MTASPLLKLPKELRDIIYEYALTEHRGLLVHYNQSLNKSLLCRFVPTYDHTRHEPNQLRYVCRQLHIETSALGLRYNDITFRSAPYQVISVYDMFDAFYASTPAKYLADIRKVTILDTSTKLPYQQVVLDELLSKSVLQFCRQNPKTKVIARFQWENRYPADCMTALSVALGRGDPFPSSPGVFRCLSTVALGTWFEGAGASCPDNLRFSCSHGLDETAHKEEVRYQRDMALAWGVEEQENNKKTEEERITLTRRLHEEGV